MDRREVPAFGIKDKLGYMFGDVANNFTFILVSTVLMKFYSDVMGVSVGLIGIMMMVARFVDAFTDVAMGQLVDRSKVRKAGKFKPWILWMSGPVSLASFLMYASRFSNADMGFKIVWMFFTYLLWGSVFYTSINIPYGSMASAITSDTKGRAQLSNWRTIGSSLGGAFIGVVLPIVVYYTDENGNQVLSGSKVALFAFLCSVGAFLSYLLCYYLTTERVPIEQKKDRFSIKKLITDLIGNKALIGIVLASVCLLFVQLTLQTMITYVYPNYFRNIAAQSAIGLAGTVITLICAGFTVSLSQKYGRKELSIVSSVFGAIVFAIAWLLQIKDGWIFLVVYSIAFVGMAVFSLIGWAMITDVIDDTEVKTGERSDGTIYAVYSFSRKLGQAAASGISGLLLSAIGYTTATQFDPEVTKGIYNVTCLVPSVGYVVLALVLLFLYPLNKKQVEKNESILKEKHQSIP